MIEFLDLFVFFQEAQNTKLISTVTYMSFTSAYISIMFTVCLVGDDLYSQVKNNFVNFTNVNRKYIV